MTQHPKRCENKMTGDVITLSKDEYERLAAYRKRVIPYMCPDEAKDWQVFFDLVETRTHSSASEPPEICCKCEDTPDVCGSDRIRCERAQAASEAREKVLDEIFGYISTKGVEKRPEGYYVVFGTFSLADMLEYLESLRQQEGP